MHIVALCVTYLINTTICPILQLLQVREAAGAYHYCVEQANERHSTLLRTKRVVVQQTRELLLQCDNIIKAVTLRYFQMQQQLAAASPLQVICVTVALRRDNCCR